MNTSEDNLSKRSMNAALFNSHELDGISDHLKKQFEMYCERISYLEAVEKEFDVLKTIISYGILNESDTGGIVIRITQKDLLKPRSWKDILKTCCERKK